MWLILKKLIFILDPSCYFSIQHLNLDVRTEILVKFYIKTLCKTFHVQNPASYLLYMHACKMMMGWMDRYDYSPQFKVQE